MPSTRPTRPRMPAFLTSRPSSRSTPASSCALIVVDDLVDRRALLDDLADADDRLVEARRDLAQLRGSSRRGSRRARGRSGRRATTSRRRRPMAATSIAPPPRRRGSRRASRRSRRRPRPSARPAPASSAAAPRRRGPSSRRRDGRDLLARSGRCSSRPQHAVQQVRRRSGGRPRAGRCRRSTRASSRPPLGDDRGLAPDPRQRAEDDVELRVDRLDRGLERAQVLGLDALERAAERGKAVGDRAQAAGAPGSARPRARATTTTASTTLQEHAGVVVLMPCSPKPSVSAFM